MLKMLETPLFSLALLGVLNTRDVDAQGTVLGSNQQWRCSLSRKPRNSGRYYRTSSHVVVSSILREETPSFPRTGNKGVEVSVKNISSPPPKTRQEIIDSNLLKNRVLENEVRQQRHTSWIDTLKADYPGNAMVGDFI